MSKYTLNVLITANVLTHSTAKKVTAVGVECIEMFTTAFILYFIRIHSSVYNNGSVVLEKIKKKKRSKILNKVFNKIIDIE